MKKKVLIILISIVIILETIAIVEYRKNKFDSKGYAGIVTGGEQNSNYQYVQVYTAKDLRRSIKNKKRYCN